jgi:hypothetical protein
MVAALCMACGAGYHALTASTAGYHAFQVEPPPLRCRSLSKQPLAAAHSTLAAPERRARAAGWRGAEPCRPAAIAR